MFITPVLAAVTRPVITRLFPSKTLIASEVNKLTSGYVRTLGKGSYGQCKLSNIRGQDVVVKEFNTRHSLNTIKHEGKMIQLANGAGGTPRLLGVHYGRRIIVQEFVQGCTMNQILRQNVLTGPQWVVTLCKLTQVLGTMHDKNLIHNDLKLANVMVNITDTGRVDTSIIDLGLARTNGTKLDIYNPNTKQFPWMDPRILHGHRCTPASDVYGLGYIINKVQQVMGSQYDVLEPIKKDCLQQLPADRPLTKEIYSCLLSLWRADNLWW